LFWIVVIASSVSIGSVFSFTLPVSFVFETSCEAIVGPGSLLLGEGIEVLVRPDKQNIVRNRRSGCCPFAEFWFLGRFNFSSMLAYEFLRVVTTIWLATRGI
jgi:hypothetical protein